MNKFTKAELKAKLATLGNVDNESRNKVVCALIGHSRIVSVCFGYITCSRCEEQIGDTLMSGGERLVDDVVVGHGCDKCRANFLRMTWRDKLYAADPQLDGEAE